MIAPDIHNSTADERRNYVLSQWECRLDAVELFFSCDHGWPIHLAERVFINRNVAGF